MRSDVTLQIKLGLVGTALLLLATCAMANAHSDAIIQCSNNIVYQSVTKLNETRMTNGLLDEHYDSNGDGRTDIHVLSSIKYAADEDGLTPHDPNPIFWLVDLNFDGREDKIYVDKRGEGKCDDIVLYQDLTVPSERDIAPETPPTQRPRDTDRRRL